MSARRRSLDWSARDNRRGQAVNAGLLCSLDLRFTFRPQNPIAPCKIARERVRKGDRAGMSSPLPKPEPAITPELVAQHGLKPDEYARILSLIGREPSFTELGIFSAMWNEHCSYKSSRLHLRKLPVTGKCVIQGPGENAGGIDIGDGIEDGLKMESK